MDRISTTLSELLRSTRPEFRVFLIHPSSCGKAALAATLATSEHLGLAYIAASLQRINVSTRIIDLESDFRNPEEIAYLVVKEKCRLVGFSPTSKSARNACELGRAIKAVSSQTIIVWGGHLATGLGSEAFQIAPEIDAIVTGYAETIAPQLALALALHNRMLHHPQVVLNSRIAWSTVEVVADASLPTWTELLPVRSLSAEIYKQTGARIVTSLGCLFDCTFCTTPFFSGRRLQQRSMTHVLDEIMQLSELGVSRVWINDDLFIDGSPASRVRGREFATRFHARFPRMRFRPMCRATTFKNDLELLSILTASGMDAIFIGLESGDDGALAELRKHSTSVLGQWVAHRIDDLGIVLQPGFIMFTPDSTFDMLRNNVNFLHEIGQLYRFFPVTRTSLGFPGTDLWKQLHASGRIDLERSTPFLIYPQFARQEIRNLSVAFELLEEEFASVDSQLYRLFGKQALPVSIRASLCDQIRRWLLGALELAASGASTENIVAAAAPLHERCAFFLESALNQQEVDGTS